MFLNVQSDYGKISKMYEFVKYINHYTIELMEERKKLICIVGPTATGKSDIAVYIAQKFDGEIISADSRQVYKGMNLGTGKITKKEMQNISHHIIDITNPKNTFSAGKFQKMGFKIIRNIWKKNKIPIICGGTGFYISTLVDGLSLPDVKQNTQLRKSLNKKTTQELFSILKKIDSRRAKNIDKKNPHRLIRAIEIVQELGGVPKIHKNPIDADILFIGIKKEKEELKKRIHIRLLKRMKQGMISEIQKLYDSGISWKRLESFGLEYKYGALYLQKKLSKEEFLEQLEQAIIQYAKRQITWFKKDTRIVWVDNKEKALHLTKRFLK